VKEALYGMTAAIVSSEALLRLGGKRGRRAREIVLVPEEQLQK
jgi:hypothetical protein